MASPVAPLTLTSPGYLGLNTQDSPIGMNDKFALEANNCVIDKDGRVSSRKGWIRAHTTNVDLGTSDITCIGELVENNGTKTTVAAGGAFLFKLDGSTLTTLTYGGGGVAPVITASNWQLVSLNGIAIFFQRGHDPLVYDPSTLATASLTTFRRLSETTGYAGTVPQANCALSAYGRIWCADTTANKSTVTFSDLITPQVWAAGTSGTLDLLGVWPHGSSEIVALAAHNNSLIIFGTKQTLIYTGANTPSTMTLSDTLTNIGCVGRDTVQNTGSDIVFLSDCGVRAIGRTIQEKSAPLGRWSKNVHIDIQSHVTANLGEIKSVYSTDQAFYLLTFPTSQITYCFDTLVTLEDGSSRVTTWGGVTSTSFAYTKSRKLYMGKPGYIGQYSGYLDDAAQYRMSYFTPWMDFGNPIQESILKKITATVLGSDTQTIVFKWTHDFDSHYQSESTTIVSNTGDSEYAIDEYGIGEWSSGKTAHNLSINATGRGALTQLGFEAQVNNKPVSFQKVTVYCKQGRLP